MKIDISFVMLSHNDGKTVINAIKSIKKLKTKYKYDIFVVDNGSENSTPEMVKSKFKDVRIVKLPKNIGTAAYDKAIKISKAKYVYFTGCDVEFKPDMLDKLVNFLEKNDDTAQAAPRYIDFHNRKKTDLAGTWLSKSFYSGTFKDNSLGNNPVEIPYIGTGLIRKNIIDKFGYLFDNDYFFYGEDVDLGLRLRLLGHKIYYIPDAIVYHVGSVSRKIHKPAFLTFLMERNLLRTFYTSLSLKSIIILEPYVYFMRLAAILRDTLKLRFDDAFARLKAIIWVVINMGKIMGKRKKVQNMRKVNDKALFKFFSEKNVLR